MVLFSKQTKEQTR